MKNKIGIDFSELTKLKKNLAPSLFDKVFVSTSNERVNAAFSKTRTQIKKKWNVDIKKDGAEWAFANKKTGKVNKRNGRIRLIRATVKDKYIIVDIGGSPLNLSLFEYTWNMEVQSKKKFKTKRNVVKRKNRLTKTNQSKVRVKILKSQVTTLNSAFIATMKSGHQGIFQRTSNGSLPILEKRTITPQSMFEQTNFHGILDKEIETNFMKRFNHNLNRLTNGYWK